MKGRTVLLGLLTTLVAAPALAGGLYLNEFGTPSMGTAGAGRFALGEDASTSFELPAGMTRIDGNELMLTFGLLGAEIEFDPDPATPVPGNDGGNAGGPAPLLGLFYVRSLSDRLKFGLSSLSTSAAILDYDDGWTGRFLAEEVSIFTISLIPTVAYKVSDTVSLGAGLAMLYGILDMEVAVPLPGPGNREGQIKLDGLDDFALGFNVSALFEPGDRTRLGLVYASEIEAEMSGDVEIALGAQAAIDTAVPFAQLVGLSTYHQVSERWELLTSARWEDWSTLDNQFISVARGSVAVPRNWEDTYHLGLGFRLRKSDEWLLKFGAAYDTSPVDAVDRTPDLAVDRQWRLAFGAVWDKSDKLDVGFEFTYADLGSARIDNDLLLGEYESNRILLFAVNFNWKRGS